MSGSRWLIGGLLAAGCSMQTYVRTAYYGDLRSLKKEISSAAVSGRISHADVVDLAEAVARRELRSARGEEAVARIRVARSCVGAVEPELRERAETQDDAGAGAMLVLADAGKISREPLVGRYAHASSGALRAVAARGTARPEHAPIRRAFYVDPDERVRREALRAAFDAGDPEDLEALLEAARLDPDPLSRSLATRAVGRIGGARASIGLADLWASAEGPARLAIIDAWAASGVLPVGGEAALVRAAEAGGSMASVAAAAALVRASGDGARIGRAVLARAIKEGTTEERIVAIQLAPLSDAEALSALDGAAKSDDSAARVFALARLAEVPSRRASALTQLESAAKAQDSAARQARLALAAANDPAAVPFLEHDLASAGPSYREQAALALFRLGKPAKMAASLADPDPSVRMSVACALLSPPYSG